MIVVRGFLRTTIGFGHAQMGNIAMHGHNQRHDRVEKPYAAPARQSAHHDGQTTSSGGLIQYADGEKALPE
jgi:hypothetical protein